VKLAAVSCAASRKRARGFRTHSPVRLWSAERAVERRGSLARGLIVERASHHERRHLDAPWKINDAWNAHFVVR
jgi:hypothetical protein